MYLEVWPCEKRLSLWPRLTLNPRSFSCLRLLSSVAASVYHHIQLVHVIFEEHRTATRVFKRQSLEVCHSLRNAGLSGFGMRTSYADPGGEDGAVLRVDSLAFPACV